MARIRTVKPEYFTSTQVAECSPLARLLFIGMWCFCDDGGVHPADPMRLKMEVFPADPFTKDQMVEWIGELLSQGLLVEFESDGKRFWSVTGWHHQKIEKKTIKHPQRKVAEESSSSRRGVVEESPNGSREVAEASPPEGKGRDTDTEGNGKGRENPLNPPEGDGEVDSASEENSSSEETVPPKKTKSLPVDPEIPPSMDVPEFREAFAAWLAYKRERGQGYKPSGLVALVKKLTAMGPAASVEAIHSSMAQNYAGIFPPRDGPARASQGAWNAPAAKPQGETNQNFIKVDLNQLFGTESSENSPNRSTDGDGGSGVPVSAGASRQADP